MILNDFNQAIERKLAAGAVEFALDKYQESRLVGSVDGQLQAAQMLYDASKQALAHLMAVHYDPAFQARIGPIGIA